MSQRVDTALGDVAAVPAPGHQLTICLQANWHWSMYAVLNIVHMCAARLSVCAHMNSQQNSAFLPALAAQRRDSANHQRVVPISSIISDQHSPAATSNVEQGVESPVSHSCSKPIAALIRQLQQSSELLHDSHRQLPPLQPSMGQLLGTQLVLVEPPTAARPAAGLQQPISSRAPPSSFLPPLHSISEAHAAPECRICLSTEPPGDLVQPCHCRGTLGFSHITCLAAWAAERCSLVCELCGQHYTHPYDGLLEPVVKAAMQHRKRAAQQAASRNSSSSHRDGDVSAGPRGRYQLTRQDWCCVM